MRHQPIEGFAIIERSATLQPTRVKRNSPSATYFILKRLFDISASLLLLPVAAATLLGLMILNPFKNKGPLFYVQSRMGQDCKPFKAIKFRTMTVADKIDRGVNDPLEVDRITPLGKLLRRSRLDELPQILNVLKGDMSLIGPRPDYYAHAEQLVETIPGYKERHSVVPGISGYAQTEIGYADTHDMVCQKVMADTYYISNRSIKLEAWILWRTIQTVMQRQGV